MMEKVILEQSLEDAEESILLHLGAKMCSDERKEWVQVSYSFRSAVVA